MRAFQTHNGTALKTAGAKMLYFIIKVLQNFQMQSRDETANPIRLKRLLCLPVTSAKSNNLVYDSGS